MPQVEDKDLYTVRVHCVNCGETTVDVGIKKGTSWESGVATLPCEHCGNIGCWVKIRTVTKD